MTLPILNQPKLSPRELYKQQVQAQLEGGAKEKLDPLLSAIGRARIERTKAFLLAHLSLRDQQVVDLGSGVGVLAQFMVDQGALVTAGDVLEYKKPTNFTFVKCCLPYHSLLPASFEGVLMTDVIAEIEPRFHRLLISEVAELVKKEGWFACSTPLELGSYDAKEQFFALVQTEFDVVEEVNSYHRLYLMILSYLSAPARFERGGKEKAYRLRQLEKRRGGARLWFYLQTLPIVFYFWGLIARLISRLKNYWEQSDASLKICERFGEALFKNWSLSHTLILAFKKKIL